MISKLKLFLRFLIYRLFFYRVEQSKMCSAGKTALITGGNGGIGYNTALVLASRGCKVILADCVDGSGSVNEIIRITGNINIFYKFLDLSRLKTVREFAEEIKRNEKKIDIFINNAGIGASRQKVTEDGLNYVMQVNYFGAFLLTHLLVDLLKQAQCSKVVFMGSITIYYVPELTMDTLNITEYEINDEYIKLLYCNSKLCNALAAREFGRRLEKHEIHTFAFDPFCVKTTIITNANKILSNSVVNFLLNLTIPISALNIRDIAETLVFLVTSPEVKNNIGGYYLLNKPEEVPKDIQDEVFCKSIWKLTEALVKLKTKEILD